jgi:pathogenesis-related protein 1
VTLRRNLVVCCLIFAAPAVNSNTLPEPGDNVERAIVAAHNEIRGRVEVPPLRWSDRLAEHAQEWASRLLREREFYHRPHPVYGENLFEITGARASAAQVIDVWASEAPDYSYRDNTCRAVCGHYTQLIWSDTREVGCAVARDASREVWVCNYNPPGNWIGERPY